MADLVAILNFILAIWPLVEEVVAMIEQIFASKSGEEKKVAAIGMVNNLVAVGSPGVVVPEGVVGKVVDAVVWAKNLSGEFVHSEGAEVEDSPFDKLNDSGCGGA